MEERCEREQYYAARIKAVNRPEKCISIITDGTDQKTCLPFYTNPHKALGSDCFLKTKVIATIVQVKEDMCIGAYR
jgi:hypothetical protein